MANKPSMIRRKHSSLSPEVENVCRFHGVTLENIDSFPDFTEEQKTWYRQSMETGQSYTVEHTEGASGR